MSFIYPYTIPYTIPYPGSEFFKTEAWYGEFIKERNRLLHKKIYEISGVDVETEEGRAIIYSFRFPKVVCEMNNGCEKWYYNDGSEKGVFLIGFGIPLTENKEGVMSVKYDIIYTEN